MFDVDLRRIDVFKKADLVGNVPVLNLWIQQKNCLLDKFTVLQHCSEPETDPCWSELELHAFNARPVKREK